MHKPHQVLEVIRSVGSEMLMAGSDLPENLGVEMLKILQLEIGDEDERNIRHRRAWKVVGVSSQEMKASKEN